ncbi:uncharacterized protein UTRI_01076 [Ustilago trichophora]|uniref:Uncharacterized protein n=1 Tax=Ustilago trichophora TaxID=86804 RepID=A0A5C3DW08_9BASI|nr:uncharacterized protein UTRI_01076 [Ustilago trichophora]
MSLSSLATASDRTITQSSSPLESSLEFSAATTACNTFSGDRKDKPPHLDANEFRRRPFRRLPIPEALISPTKFEPEADSVGVRLGYGLPTPYQEEREAAEEESFPESPGNSPLSHFQHSHQREDKEETRFSLSPPALRTKHWRNRSEPEAGSGKQLYPSPPRLRLEIQPEDLIPAAKRKVLKRKPIPQSLFVQASAEEKQRSWSVPDIFGGTLYGEDREKPDIDRSNQLGLFFPPTIDSQAQVTGITPPLLANTKPTYIEPQTHTQTQRQLRRSTRSISESLPRPRLPFAVAATHDFEKVRLGVHAGGSPDSTEFEPSPRSSGGSDSSDVWEENQPRRGRTRSGSAPVYTTGQGLRRGETEKRHILRRVSRRQEGEMRSVYLSRPSPSACPGGAHYKVLPTSMLDNPNSALAETEGIEVLRTPDPPTQPTFAPPLTHQHNYNMSSFSSSIYDSLRSGSSDNTFSLSHHHNHNRGRSSSESSMASLLVLQQHIQQRNHLRQFAPPGMADPNLPPDLQRRLSREQHSPAVDMAETVVKEEGERSAGGMVGQFGALRIKNFALGNDDDDEEEQFQLPYLSSWNSSDSKKEAASAAAAAAAGAGGTGGAGGAGAGGGAGGAGGAGGGELRHMFSNPLFPSIEDSSPPPSLGSLRERRAKPPIRIALTPTAAPTTNCVNQLRKKASKCQVLSPTTTTTVHSPPPHPPPTTPLPDLPVPPGSAPAGGGGKQQQRLLVKKRSWTRSSSTPVSPNIVVTAQRRYRNHHGLTQSQGDISAPLPIETSVRDGWDRLATPVTAELPALVHDGQPDTPLTATTESAITPVRPTAGKFDGLLAFLSSKNRNSSNEGVRDSPRAKKILSNHRHSGEELPTSSSAGPIVYGLAL